MWEARDDLGRVHQLPFDEATTPQEALQKITASLPPGSTLQKGSFNIARTPAEAAQAKIDSRLSQDERVAQVSDLLAGAMPAQQTHLQAAARGYDGASGLSWRTTAQNILKGTAGQGAPGTASVPALGNVIRQTVSPRDQEAGPGQTDFHVPYDIKSDAKRAEQEAAESGTDYIRGEGRYPRIRWKEQNEDGSVLTVEKGRELAKQFGVEIADDVEIIPVDEGSLGDAGARYFGQRVIPGQQFRWSDFVHENGKVRVRIDSRFLRTDEGFVAQMAHEMHEINNLRRLFAETPGGTMSAQRLANLIDPDVDGRLHLEAWDVSDKIILKMRETRAQK